MKKNINIIKKDTLTNREFQNLLEESERSNKTINLSSEISQKKRQEDFVNNTKKRKQKQKINKFLSIYIKIWYIFFLVWITIIWIFYFNSSKVVAQSSIKQILNLEWCKTIQTEDEHIKQWNGSMYAMDIACTRWENFKVYSPLWKNKYLVVKKSYDSRLGNYIVLKHWEYTFVFAHIESNLKVGERINWGIEIWKTNISWISQNYHLHFELWKNDYNISYKEMLGENTRYNMEKTFDLRYQRNWDLKIEETAKFITDFEGFIKCAKWDWKQYSNWFSTKARYAWECISESEAIQRKMIYVKNTLREIYTKHFLKYHNQRIALASAMYNLWNYSPIIEVKNLKSEKSIKKHFNKFIFATIDWEKKKLWWLIKRRELEALLFLGKL